MLALVMQVGSEPALHRSHVESLSARIVFDLIAADLADAEVLGLGPPEVEAAHRRRGKPGEGLRERNARVRFRAQEIEQRPLLGVVGARRIPRRGANALIL